jgi:hypothetical protein
MFTLQVFSAIIVNSGPPLTKRPLGCRAYVNSKSEEAGTRRGQMPSAALMQTGSG